MAQLRSLTPTASVSSRSTSSPTRSIITRSSFATPSVTKSISITSTPTPAPNHTGEIVGYSILAFFSTWFLIITVTFCGACLLSFEGVCTIMCSVGTTPAMYGRSLGVWMGSVILHCALLPLLNVVCFILGFSTGSIYRVCELGLLAIRAFQPNTQCYNLRHRNRSLPRNLLPDLPHGYPLISPPAHRYKEGPPPPWEIDAQQGGIKYKAWVHRACIQPFGCKNDGICAYQCLPSLAGRILGGCASLGIFCLVAGLQQGLIILFAIPIAGALAAFAASLLYIPAGLASVFVSCFSWEGHVYTVLPRLCERVGVVLAERTVDLVAWGLTTISLMPVYCLGLLVTRRVALSRWAIQWLHTLRTGASVPPIPETGESDESNSKGTVLLYAPPYDASQVMRFQQQPSSPVAAGIEMAVLTRSYSGRTMFIQRLQTSLYPPLGIANYYDGPASGTSIWNVGAAQTAFYPAPPSLLPPQPFGDYFTGAAMYSRTFYTSDDNNNAPPPAYTDVISSPSDHVVMNCMPMALATAAATTTCSMTDPSIQLVDTTQSTCCGCFKPLALKSTYYFIACDAKHSVCLNCYNLALHARLSNTAILSSLRNWDELLRCPWSTARVGGSGCRLVAQGNTEDTNLSLIVRRLHSALNLSEAESKVLKKPTPESGYLFALCERTLDCPGLLFNKMAAIGVEEAVVWSQCVVCGKVDAEAVKEAPVESVVAIAAVVTIEVSATPQPLPLWPSFLFSVGELPLSLPRSLVILVASPAAPAAAVGFEEMN